MVGFRKGDPVGVHYTNLRDCICLDIYILFQQLSHTSFPETDLGMEIHLNETVSKKPCGEVRKWKGTRPWEGLTLHRGFICFNQSEDSTGCPSPLSWPGEKAARGFITGVSLVIDFGQVMGRHLVLFKLQVKVVLAASTRMQEGKL